jgi:hypothetical protein
MKETNMLNILSTTAEIQTEMSQEQQAVLSLLSEQIEKLNASMRRAVDAGMTIELRRSSRHHQEDGYWGDIIAPAVVKTA